MKIANKLRDLEYDELITLCVIEYDDDLSSIFSDEVKMSYNMLRTLSKENKLSDETKAFIRDLFDKIILTKTNLINKYVHLAQVDGKPLSPLSTPEITQEVIKKVKSVGKPKKEKVLPRRYGKALISKDIQNQGGKPTNAQLTALDVNWLKNTYVNLNARLINDMLTSKPILTDEDYRDIRSAIDIMKNKLKKILKKK